ncbi:DNA polymerase beta superfamily protein [Salinibacillus xinjiangensis]|uniref:Nucleotidyltransferase n=1 Tax=Salinibacillus xinjiangensis TaxID=1229268 RepID=A0A6G1X4N3_9BACI|nr:nucleotidyltransferase domain-containing protein [Salinibacillus xinjiangensis]MRG85865.1 hypothetical protein [Salinibacillus xinjiangensis]
MSTQEFLQLLRENTIYRVITGSTAYGLNVEHSDIDEKAFVILPPTRAFTLGKEWETDTFHNPDIEFHSLKKAMNLLNSQNPTILETLFVSQPFVVKQTKHGKWIRENRELFLSQNCYHSFGGYAKDQLMRIKNGLQKATPNEQLEHLEYKLNQMVSEMKERYPALEDGMIQVQHISKDSKGNPQSNLSVQFNQISLTELNGITTELTNAQKSYSKKDRQTKKPTEQLYKHAMHLLRLLMMGTEILKEGRLTVYQEKQQTFLKGIRNQEYSWDEIFTIAEDLFEKLRQAKEQTILPKSTDKSKINKLYTDIIQNYYGLS